MCKKTKKGKKKKKELELNPQLIKVCILRDETNDPTDMLTINQEIIKQGINHMQDR